MCFSPKIKTPKVDTNQIVAPTPAPLTENATGVSFGGQDDGSKSSETGVASTTVEKSTKSTGIKGAIRARMTGK